MLLRRWEQNRQVQHLSALHGQLSNKIEVQRQSPWCMFLKEKVEEEGGEEHEKEQRRRAATCENGPPGPGCRNEGFPTSSVFDTIAPGIQVKAMETSFVYLDKEMEEERGRQVRKEKWERMQSCAGSSWSPPRRFVAVRTRWKEEKNQEKKNSQGEDPRTLNENSQGMDLRTEEENSQGEDPQAPLRVGIKVTRGVSRRRITQEEK